MHVMREPQLSIQYGMAEYRIPIPELAWAVRNETRTRMCAATGKTIKEVVEVENDVREKHMTIDAGPNGRQVYILTKDYLEQLATVLAGELTGEYELDQAPD